MKTIEAEEKKFDAIIVMRQIRDELNLEIMDMTYREEKAHLAKILTEHKAESKKGG